MEANPEPPDYVKMDWILSLIDALSYAHSRRAFLDEIALRNILVVEGQLKLADFVQSILLPAAADVNTICENDLTAMIEILHLGWIIYSAAVWQVRKYYFFDRGNMHWPEPQALPNTDKPFCGRIIEKCWRGEYANMDALNEEAHFLLHGLDA
jgi:serine/threonine protein kinase